MKFDGETFDPERDEIRLSELLQRVKDYMKDGEWRGLAAIQHECGGTEASVSARLRDLRKARFGGHTVQRRYLHDGLWEYRLVINHGA